MWSELWLDVVRVLVAAATAYVTLVVVLRVSEKRTLAKLNAFDFVITCRGRRARRACEASRRPRQKQQALERSESADGGAPTQ